MIKRGLYLADYFEGSGFGHVRRFQAYKELLDDVVLELATQENFQDESRYLNWDKNPILLEDLIKNFDFVIVDSYVESKNIIEIFERHYKPIFIDDFRRRMYRRGLIIDGTINAEKWRRQTGDISCFGLEYSLVRNKFYLHKDTTVEFPYAFIFGGHDPQNYLQSFYASAPPNSIFLATSACPSFHKLKDHDRIYWNTNIDEFINLVRKSDFVISTAGQTLYELHAMGKSFLSIVFNENHEEDGIGFMQEEGMNCIVDDGNSDDVVRKTLSHLNELPINYRLNPRKVGRENKLKSAIVKFLA